MNQKLWILGAGQYGMAAKETAEAMNRYRSITFLDDNSPLAVGKLDTIRQYRTQEDTEAFVAMGNPGLRKCWLQECGKPATLIHPKAVVMPSARIGEGSIIEAGAVISSNARIGRGTIVMAGAVVGHDAEVGDYCQLKYGCVIPEREQVPEGTRVECNRVWSRTDAEMQQKENMEAYNRRFLQEEKERTGAEPSFF